MLPYLRAAYGLALTAGLLLGVLWIAYALGQLPGALADRGFFDEAFVLLAALAGASVLISVRCPGRWGIE